MLYLRMAGPPVRFLAWGIDTVLILVVQLFLAICLGFLGDVGMGFYLLALFALSWFYPVVFEVFRNGATPGKKALGLMVVHDDGTPVGLTASFLRNLLRVADFLPAAYGFGLVSMFLSSDFKRLGDHAAGTLVVHREELVLGQGVPAAPPVAPPVLLEREEQRAVINFGERLETWNEERAEELASTLEPLTGLPGAAGVKRLLGMANWLLGRTGEAA